MAGVKGRSGRRSKSIEQRRRDAIQKAWDAADKVLSGDELKEQQFDMAKSIVVKSMPDQLQHTGDMIIRLGHRG